MTVVLPEMHPTLRELLELSRKRKWVSYEELNTTLPDEMVDPEKLDELLVLLDRLDIDCVDEITVRRNKYESFQAPLQTNLKFKRDDPRRAERQSSSQSSSDDDDAAPPEPEEDLGASASESSEEILDEADAQAVIEEAIADSGSKRIDDPIRMYLTQMGTIPLLTRLVMPTDAHLDERVGSVQQ